MYPDHLWIHWTIKVGADSFEILLMMFLLYTNSLSACIEKKVSGHFFTWWLSFHKSLRDFVKTFPGNYNYCTNIFVKLFKFHSFWKIIETGLHQQVYRYIIIDPLQKNLSRLERYDPPLQKACWFLPNRCIYPVFRSSALHFLLIFMPNKRVVL